MAAWCQSSKTLSLVLKVSRMKYFFTLQINSFIGGSTHPWHPPVQILSFSCSFQQKICKIIALLGVGTPPSRKSWISHCRLHVPYPSPSLSNFIIVPMMTDHFMDRMGLELILSVNINLTVCVNRPPYL